MCPCSMVSIPLGSDPIYSVKSSLSLSLSLNSHVQNTNYYPLNGCNHFPQRSILNPLCAIHHKTLLNGVWDMVGVGMPGAVLCPHTSLLSVGIRTYHNYHIYIPNYSYELINYKGSHVIPIDTFSAFWNASRDA